jgi:hypothetical protein
MRSADEPPVPDHSPNITTSNLVSSQLKIVTTGPEFLLGHWISDEQLEMLRSVNRDGLSEAFWAFVGAAFAAFPSAVEAVWSAYLENPHVPLSVLHLIEVGIVIGSACIACCIWLISGWKSKRVKDLVDEIRGRQRA